MCATVLCCMAAVQGALGQDTQLGQWAACLCLKNHACFVSFLVVKKKGTAGLKLSNLMNLGRKKSSSLDSPERSLETSSK